MNLTNPTSPPDGGLLPDGNTIEVPAVKEEPAGTGFHRPNQFARTDDPKKYQFTGRATSKESDRIKEAIEVRKQRLTPGQTYDIVRLVLDCLDHIEADILQTFKTKKKK